MTPEMLSDFREWLQAQSTQGPWAALHDYDADGICAGALWAKLAQYLNRPFSRMSAGNLPENSGSRDIEVHLPWLAAQRPTSLFILDLGSWQRDALPNIPTLYIDHHRQEPGSSTSTQSLVLNGCQLDPIPCTSLLLFELMQGLGDFSRWDWMAAVGAYSDLGDKAPFEVVQRATLRHTRKVLREVTGLVNSGRRGPHFRPEWAAQALLTHEDPQELLQSRSECVQGLKDSQKAAQEAFKKAKNCRPRFSHEAALLLINTPCRIHGLVAQIWKNRLPNHYVVVGNIGLPGNFVEYSTRCRRDKNVLEWLLPRILPLTGNPPNGHNQASGGRLPRERWPDLLDSLGFSFTPDGPAQGDGFH